MSEGQAETTTQTATQPTPAAATAVAEKPTATATTAAQVETKTETQTVKTPDPKEVARQAFQSREQKREKKASERLAEIEKEFAAYKADIEKTRSTTKEPEVVLPSVLEDPEGYARQVREQAKQDAIEAIKAENQKADEEAKFKQSADNAAQWLLTRSHLKQDAALVKEVAQVIAQKYAHVAGVDPSAAAELSYLAVCKAKGIAPDIEGFSAGGMDATKGAATTGSRPTAAPGGQRVFSRAEAESYVMQARPGSADFKKRLAEIEQAKAEGRIR